MEYYRYRIIANIGLQFNFKDKNLTILLKKIRIELQ
jgi:hypothetical protein